MLNLFNTWQGKVVVNGVEFNNIQQAIDKYGELGGEVDISLIPNEQIVSATVKKYRLEVKNYMTKPATEDFDFMDKWNGGKPMPLKIMVGTIENETRGMYYMKLKADTLSGRPMERCLKCGKPITNRISQYFGLGPVCGNHSYTNPFNTQEELDKAVKKYQDEVISQISWEGWVIKSAIEYMEEI